MRKAQFLELDLIFAMLILIGGVLLIKSQFIQVDSTAQLDSYSLDALNVLEFTLMSDLDPQFFSSLNSDTQTELEEELSLSRQATILLINGEEEYAEILIKHVLDDVVPEGLGYEVSVVSNDARFSLATNGVAQGDRTSQSRSMMSGLAVGESVYGYTGSFQISNAYTRRLSQTFLGGFVGQGDITLSLSLPMDAQDPKLYFEGDVHEDANLYVNSIFCDSLTAGFFHSNLDEDCNQHLAGGDNTVTIDFIGDELSRQYIGGGFVEASYRSAQVRYPTNTLRYHLPGIDGVFNVYDSIFVPGKLESMKAHLVYESDSNNNPEPVILVVGGEEVYRDSTSTSQVTVDIDSNDFDAIVVDHSEAATIPFHLGFEPTTLIIDGGFASVVLVTDLSGSMDNDFRLGGDVSQLDCADINPYADEVERIALARCVDKFFARGLLENEDNQLGLVGYSTYIEEERYLDNDVEAIVNHIDEYDTNSYTCTACGIHAARAMLDDVDGLKFIVLMSDGEANRCYGGSCAGISAQGQAEHFAQEAFEDEGIIMYTVAFGYNGQGSMEDIALAAGGESFMGDDAQELAGIYESILDSIEETIVNSQIIETIGNSQSTLSEESYIEVVFEPFDQPDLFSKIVIDDKSDSFGSNACSPSNVPIASVLEPISGRVISYSAQHWTDKLTVNGQQLFDLSQYGDEYTLFGDPFVLGIPPSILQSQNTIALRTGDAANRPTQCSEHNRLIYSAAIDSRIDINQVYPRANGCVWTVQFLGGVFEEVRLPSGYSGQNLCSYTSATVGDVSVATSDQLDAWQQLGYRFFSRFDLENNGEVDLDFGYFDLDTRLVESEKIPYMWGPAILEVVVWQ